MSSSHHFHAPSTSLVSSWNDSNPSCALILYYGQSLNHQPTGALTFELKTCFTQNCSVAAISSSTKLVLIHLNHPWSSKSIQSSFRFQIRNLYETNLDNKEPPCAHPPLIHQPTFLSASAHVHLWSNALTFLLSWYESSHQLTFSISKRLIQFYLSMKFPKVVLLRALTDSKCIG